MRKNILLFAFFLAPLCAFAQQGNQSLPSGSGGGISFGIGAGTAQAQTVNPSTAIVTLTTGLQVCWLPLAANTAAAPTLSVSALTAKPITKYGTVALVANDITAAAVACAIYDGTEFQLQNPLAGGVFSGSLSIGSGASAAGATATGGFACVEGASTGWTPTAGQDYQRCDATLHNFVCSLNGAAEGACGGSNAVVTNPSATQTITATGAATLPLAIISPASASNYALTVRTNAADLVMGVDPEASGSVSFYGAGGNNGVVALGNTGSPNFYRVDPTNNLTTTTGGIKALYEMCIQAAANGHAAANTITDECPAVVTAYENVRPGTLASGLLLNSGAAGVNTQSFSGDTNHSIHVTAQTATKTLYTICPASAGGCNVAGQYRVTWYFNQGGTACGTPTPGQVTFALSWTDNAGAHSAIALPMNDNSSIAVFTSAFKFASTNVTGFASGEFNLWSTGAQPIQVTNTYTACGVGTGTWELTAAVEQVQ